MRKPCAVCGVEYEAASNRAKYCSERCRRGENSCEQCGKLYIPTRHGRRPRFCSTECFYEKTVPTGSVILVDTGYLIEKVPLGTPGVKMAGNRGRWMLQHRYVVQKAIGRPLQRSENVHHKNGIKTDNRIENLELWNRAQPYGVRASDYHCPGCICSAN